MMIYFRSTRACIFAVCLLITQRSTLALFEEEAGISDFLVATAGHGPTKFVHASEGSDGSRAVITSDSPSVGHQLLAKAPETSCYVASRAVDSGVLNWRRDVCSHRAAATNDNPPQMKHAVGAAQDALWTMDSSGVIRAWNTKAGQLLWDALSRPTEQPRILVAGGVESPNAVGAVADELMTLLDATTGEALGDPLDAQQVLKQHGSSSRGQARWFQIISDEKDSWEVLLGWVDNRDGVVVSNGNDMMLITLEWQQEGQLKILNSQRLNHIKQIDVSSLSFLPTSKNGIALSADGKQAMVCGITNCETADIATSLSWSRLTSMVPMGETVATVSGVSEAGVEQQALLQIPSLALVTVPPSESLSYAAFAGSNNAYIVRTQSGDPAVEMWTSTDGGSTLQKVIVQDFQTNELSNRFETPTVTVLNCAEDSLDLLFSTFSGTTSAVQMAFSSSSSASATRKWTAEEGLGHITSALLLDASHAVVVDDLVGEDSEQEPAEIARRLQFSSRLSSQWKSLVGGALNLVSSSSNKDRLFGFLQVAVLVSERTDRLYGMELSGSKRGSILWTLDLLPQASWHKLVHGTFNAPKATHGIQGGTHARELLVVSAGPSQIDWKCVDGTHGDVHAEGSLKISSPVLQVIPMVGSGLCRQQAVLMHADHSISTIPEIEGSAQSSLGHALEARANGIFAHYLHQTDTSARLESFQVTSQSTPARLVGQASFLGEKLVYTVYPYREEVVQSPCTVLGDDSLLLKYLNPHLVVLVTVRDDGALDEEDSIDAVLRKSKQQTDKKKKKKPLGATPKAGGKVDPTTADSTAEVKEDDPNLFVNVVDTVSGRILHRVSHANAATSSRHIRAVISENWVIYSFVNAKTRKTEVGVLSLYEGMIHRKGLTAFTSPEQTTEFSSWDARETKPVVLSKTYSIPRPVTAMGVTQTRNGISSHQILLATSDDRVYAVERKVLEPRRPLSDLKESEKTEGLRQYSELIPLISLQALSYNLTVHAPTHILSSPTELESQTLVFAYGGPDLFFSRTSPSKGFDMLPESFNRGLLLVLLLALSAVIVVTKRMANQKIVKQGWV